MANKISKKGVAPDTAGTPGVLVSIEGMDLEFGRGGRVSPYDKLLRELAAAGAGKALKFGSIKARASVTIRAKKLEMRVSFAENQGELYVRYDGSAADDIKGSRRERIIGVLHAGVSRTAMELTNALRQGGDTTIDAQLTESILVQLVRGGDIVKQEGGTYARNPRAKRAA